MLHCLTPAYPTHPAHPYFAPSGSKGLRFCAIAISTIDNNKQVDHKFMYNRADRIPSSLGSMVVCGR